MELHLSLYFLLLEKLVSLPLAFALKRKLLGELLDLLPSFKVLDVDSDLVLSHLLIVLCLQLLVPAATFEFQWAVHEAPAQHNISRARWDNHAAVRASEGGIHCIYMVVGSCMQV